MQSNQLTSSMEKLGVTPVLLFNTPTMNGVGALQISVMLLGRAATRVCCHWKGSRAACRPVTLAVSLLRELLTKTTCRSCSTDATMRRSNLLGRQENIEERSESSSRWSGGRTIDRLGTVRELPGFGKCCACIDVSIEIRAASGCPCRDSKSARS